MQKMEHILWRGIVAAITAAALFVLMYRYSYAEEISGEEVYFTHSHVAGCKKSESANCAGIHVLYYHTSEEGTYHCNSCNAQTTHKIEINVYRCDNFGKDVTWQQNCYTKCTICGAIHSTWGTDPGTHSLYRETITCGLSQGEQTSSVKIIADGAWTNKGVTLVARQTVLKDDWSDNVTFSWGGESLFVTENGTYTVNAVNDAGASITASIEISCIDKNAPVILSVSGNTQGMTASGISVSVTAEDGESGLADAPYSVDGGATWTAGSSFWVEEGRIVSLRVRDKAGNTSEKIVKRGDFPYPPPTPTPPTATPAPAPQITSTPQSSDIKNGDKNTDIRTPEDGGESRGDGRNDGRLSENGSLSGASPNVKTSGNGKGEGGKEGSGKLESKKTGSENAKTTANTGGSGKKPQLLILKEEVQGSNAGKGFRVVRMDKAQAAGTANISTPDEGTAAMAAYMQAVTGTWAAQSDTQDGKEAAGAGARYALTGGLSLQEDRAGAGLVQRILSRLKEKAGLIAGITLFCFGILWGCRLLWLYSVELYCYDGGNEYRRLGLLYIRKRKKELDLYLPDYMLTKTGVPRYRLVVKDRLVKRFGKMDLVVHSDDHCQRRPLEECVDFVL
ncbi:MAG: hypothetical protein K2I22_01805 [Lachnospiraceae bacterium]|nr:hypothetical protein [Lachnospiraceae bacterium]